jgi:hypothetical protein
VAWSATVAGIDSESVRQMACQVLSTDCERSSIDYMLFSRPTLTGVRLPGLPRCCRPVLASQAAVGMAGRASTPPRISEWRPLQWLGDVLAQPGS